MIIWVVKIFFVQFFCVFLPLLLKYLLLLLGPDHFCPLFCPSLHEMFPWYLWFSWRDLVFPILLFSSISLHWSLRKAFFYLSLLFFGTLHSDGYVFPFPLCLLLLFSQPFLRPLQTTMATHCSVLAWRIPGTEEPSGLPSMGLHRVGQDWSNLAAAAEPFCLFAFLFLGDGLDHCLLYNVMNLCPQFFRYCVYQI